ncbi:MAG: TonB family protein [Sphingomonadales bacterium]|nr:TonB family protein [Sphingomonadales bacterium]
MARLHGYRPLDRGFGTGPDRTRRFATFAVVAVLHVAVIIGIIAAFTPDIGRRVLRTGLVALDLHEPPPPPSPPAATKHAGAVATAGRKAAVRAAAPPPPKLVVAALVPVVPPAGAAAAGVATGAGGAGQGGGTGGAGNGSGGGQRFVQIAGRIDSARDYPIETRDKRIGTSVVIVFTVGTDGRVHDCRVRDPSGDPRSDAITCRLAEERFRFRPSTDVAGNPVAATYGWRQSWHY